MLGLFPYYYFCGFVVVDDELFTVRVITLVLLVKRGGREKRWWCQWLASFLVYAAHGDFEWSNSSCSRILNCSNCFINLIWCCMCGHWKRSDGLCFHIPNATVILILIFLVGTVMLCCIENVLERIIPMIWIMFGWYSKLDSTCVSLIIYPTVFTYFIRSSSAALLRLYANTAASSNLLTDSSKYF